MTDPSPTPDDRPRPEPSWVFPLALLGAIVGYYGAMFVGLPERFWALIGAVWGVVFGLLAKQLLPKDSESTRRLQAALQLLLWLGLAVLLVTLIVFCSFIVRELA